MTMMGRLAWRRELVIFALLLLVTWMLTLQRGKYFRSFSLPSRRDIASSQWNDSNAETKGLFSAPGTAEEHFNKRNLDFAIIGFAKTGTTALSETLLKHDETAISEAEFCKVFREDIDQQLFQHIQTLRRESAHPVKVGIKCPMMVRNAQSIENIASLFRQTRLVVGIRHPVLWFQSFYNYRVQRSHEKNWTEPNGIPSPLKLTDGNQWRDISTEDARFELFLMQLAKVSLTNEDFRQLLSMQIRQTQISPNPFKIFIYSTEQLSDKNATRQQQFRTDLQNHLRMKTPITRFEHSNEAGGHHYPETINICDEKYDNLRRLLVKQGRKSSKWIRQKFIWSNDVIVSNREHFTSLLRQWGEDPCEG